jgi:hypothetical protein
MSDREPYGEKILKERLGMGAVAKTGKPQGALAATPADL